MPKVDSRYSNWFAGPAHGTGRLHVRVHDTGADGSRLADIASIVRTNHTGGATVATVSVSERHKLSDAVGLGWRDPRYIARSASGLVDATVAVAHLWAAAADNGTDAVLVLDEFHRLDTGPAGGHDDAVAADWLTAVTFRNTERLRELTGLDIDTYLGRRVDVPATTVAVTTVFRRGATRTAHDLIGGFALTRAASTVIALDARPDQDKVAGTLRLLKSRVEPPGATRHLTRPGPGERLSPWRLRGASEPWADR